MLSGISELEQEFQQEAETGKVKYGVEILDDYVGSIRKGSITFIVARPNTGKSLLSQNWQQIWRSKVIRFLYVHAKWVLVC